MIDKIPEINLSKNKRQKKMSGTSGSKDSKVKKESFTTQETGHLSYAVNKEIKQTIVLTKSRGQIFKPCPGTSDAYLCCNYWVLNQLMNCPFQCSYCILQYYLKTPNLTVYTDTDRLIQQIQERMALEPKRFFRIGTGELADSLALNEKVHVAEPLIRFAAKTPLMLLELKTKSSNIESLLREKHGGKTVLAWSINPEDIVLREEHGTASLTQRLKAIEKASLAGYKLAFHFDPILYYPDWKEGYTETIQKLFDVAPVSSIAWISMGSLRFPLEMKEKIKSRFPESHLTDAEMIRGMDGKLRYFKPFRIYLYKYIYGLLRYYGGHDLFIYFCMEDRETWQAVMGKAPGSNGELDFWFANHLYHHFPGLFPEPPVLEDYLFFSTPRNRNHD